MLDSDSIADPATSELPARILGDLRHRRLPRMVDWFDPVLLAKIGVRTIVSSTLGQYADQRLMQAATDRVSEDDLKKRYDYSEELAMASKQCALWVDYVSDLGDGFEATFAIASLMAPNSLTVKGTANTEPELTLEAGKVLVMGGDQAYPQSSPKEYQARLQDPYTWAFMTEHPDRRLFAIPGNHDWYDGLSAFDGLFCSTRSLVGTKKGKQIGGWRCQQHRSYFAIRLPHDWWIWGADIQLAGVFDDPQRQYFYLKSDQTTPKDKIILCLAEPSWLHENYDNLLEITEIAQSKGAKVCAVLAGDWHHYSRFATPKNEDVPERLDVQFITCGGGGAFAHATHSLPKTVELKWPDRAVSRMRRVSRGFSDDADTQAKPRQNVAPNGAISQIQAFVGVGDPGPAASPARTAQIKVEEHDLEAKKIYPTRPLSRLLSLKNIFLPFRNWRFSLFIGAVYFLYAWIFAISIAGIDTHAELTKSAKSESSATGKFAGGIGDQALWSNPTDAESMGKKQQAIQRARDSAKDFAGAVKDRYDIMSDDNTSKKSRNLDSDLQTFIDSADKLRAGWTERLEKLKDHVAAVIAIRPDAFAKLTPALAGPDNIYNGPMRYIATLKKQDFLTSHLVASGLNHEIGVRSKFLELLAADAGKLANEAADNPVLSEQAAAVAAGADEVRTYIQTFAVFSPITLTAVARSLSLDLANPKRVIAAAANNPAFAFLILALWLGLIYYADVATLGPWGVLAKVALGTVHFLLHMGALLLINAIAGPLFGFVLVGVGTAALTLLILSILFTKGRPVLFVLIALAILLGLTTYYPQLDTLLSQAWRNVESFLQPILQPLSSDTAKSVASDLASGSANLVGSILIGGLLGALIFGLYWAIMSALFARHTGDAFGALGLKDYKHFLRLKFESDRLTIYPIAIDKVPGRRGWRAAKPEDNSGGNNPQIVPATPLEPYLLEDPIVIKA